MIIRSPTRHAYRGVASKIGLCMDWIKLEKNTPDKPEILEMAEFLEIDPDAVMGKMIRVWSWLDSNSENGHTSNVTSVLIRRITCHEKFPDAMIHVGWLVKEESGYTIPHYDRHLGKSSKKRALDAERQRKSRDERDKRHDSSVTESLLDKRRSDTDKDIGVLEKTPKCPIQKIGDLYNETVAILPKWRVFQKETRDRISMRWKENPEFQKVSKWEKLFKYCDQNKFLSGRMDNNREWNCDLNWIVKSANFAKILNSNYDKYNS